jgi:PncC family amidohydrolase
MTDHLNPPSLETLALRVGTALRDRGETVSVTESSSGGLVSAALLAIPGASAFFVGGAVVYTKQARLSLLGLSGGDMQGLRAETEPYARLIAGRVRDNLGTTWGLGESGAAGPKGSPYGDSPGHVCLAVVGNSATSATRETGLENRTQNMDLFARYLLALFEEVLHTN